MKSRLHPLTVLPIALALAACGPAESSGEEVSQADGAKSAAPAAAPAAAAPMAEAQETPEVKSLAGEAVAPQEGNQPAALHPLPGGLPKSPDSPSTPPGKDDIRQDLLQSMGSIFSPEPEFDFGEVIQGETRNHTFIIGNQGKESLGIRSVNPTCGCTVAQVKMPSGEIIDPRKRVPNQDLFQLQPNEKAEIVVEFNSRGQPIRKITKYIQVISSDSREPALKLTMAMSVTAGIEVEPNPLQFGEIARGQKKTMRAYAKFKQVGELNVISTEPLEHFEATWEKANAPDGTAALAFDITVLPTAPVGYLAPTLIAMTDNERLKQIQIQLYVNVKSYVVFDTGNEINKERVDFQVIPFGESRKRSIEVTNGDPELPYVIESVTLDSKYQELISVELETLEVGKHYKIHLTTGPTLDARFFRGVLKVKAEHQDIPEKIVNFHGWVKKS